MFGNKNVEEMLTIFKCLKGYNLSMYSGNWVTLTFLNHFNTHTTNKNIFEVRIAQ